MVNEVILHENGQWLKFSQPQKVIQASCLDDVLPALRQVEKLVEENGWHAAGFLSYEAAPAFDPAFIVQPDEGFPLLWFGLYLPPAPIDLPAPPGDIPDIHWQPSTSRKTYLAAIAQIKEHIAAGRTYQVNYTMRLRARFNADPWMSFLRMAHAQQAGYQAYLDIGQWVIASASPELFFKLAGDTILARPMKGTTKRGRTSAEDRQQSEWLQQSIKNRAENVMIVDMLRNDIGRIAETGTVQVPALFTTERYPTLWQMTSTVTARTTASLADILARLFPCASITGAPKVSTMAIIADLETTPRRIYTGSIGHIAPGRQAQFNVAIRTLLFNRQNRQAEYGVGGGIVWDSESEDEYAEALLKARVLSASPPDFALLETILWQPQGGWFLLEGHLARLLDSADYFGFPADANNIKAYLASLENHFERPQKVRLLLDRHGRLESESAVFDPSTPRQPLRACLAPQAINSQDVFLFHKTTRRGLYESALAARPGFDDVLLYNERGELTEFTIGNLVFEIKGKRYTPPLDCGVLPGVFRAHLLETGQVSEHPLRLADLQQCDRLFRVNSVRQWQEVSLSSV